MLGVVKLVVPVPPDNTLPPVAAAYQSIVSPAPTLALIPTVPVPDLEPFTPDVGVDGNALTVTVIALVYAVSLPVVTALLL